MRAMITNYRNATNFKPAAAAAASAASALLPSLPIVICTEY